MTSKPRPAEPAYDRITVLLHWTIGIGILVLAGLELFRHEFPKGHFIREGLKPIHQPAGVVFMALIFFRATWALWFQKGPATADANVLTARAARLVHQALYLLMLAIPVAGLLSVLAAGKGVDFGPFQLAMPLSGILGEYAKSLREVHETIALTLLGLVLVHAAAALFHHYIIRDGVLRRMRFDFSRSTSGHANK
jgi:superoxide oxidase